MTEAHYVDEILDLRFSLTPINLHDEQHVAATPEITQELRLSVEERLILRTLTALQGRVVFYPLLEWRRMTEGQCEMIRAAFRRLNSVHENSYLSYESGVSI